MNDVHNLYLPGAWVLVPRATLQGTLAYLDGVKRGTINQNLIDICDCVMHDIETAMHDTDAVPRDFQPDASDHDQ